MNHRSKQIAIVLLASSLTLMSTQGFCEEEPLLQQLKQKTQSEAFSIGALLQVVGTYTDPPGALKNGFVLANVRLSMQGKLDRSWDYLIQASLIGSPAVVDAALGYRVSPILGLRFGAFKAPFSAEFLTNAANIDFVNRSQVVTVLAPGRQVGVQSSGVSAKGLGYTLGFFNGNGLKITNDNNDLMTVARLFYDSATPVGDRALHVGVQAYHSVDENAPIGVPITGNFLAEGYTGERIAAGVELRITIEDWFTSADFIASRFDPRGGTRAEPYGYQISAGFFAHPTAQFLARWDSLRLDGVAADSDLLVLGANYWPSSPTEVQLNVGFPTADASNVQVLVNVQVAF